MDKLKKDSDSNCLPTNHEFWLYGVADKLVCWNHGKEILVTNSSELSPQNPSYYRVARKLEKDKPIPRVFAVKYVELLVIFRHVL